MPDDKPRRHRRSSPVIVTLLAILIVALIASTIVSWLAARGYIQD